MGRRLLAVGKHPEGELSVPREHEAVTRKKKTADAPTVGRKIRLTGSGWTGIGGTPRAGLVRRIREIDPDGSVWFRAGRTCHHARLAGFPPTGLDRAWEVELMPRTRGFADILEAAEAHFRSSRVAYVTIRSVEVWADKRAQQVYWTVEVRFRPNDRRRSEFVVEDIGDTRNEAIDTWISKAEAAAHVYEKRS
jgi:hypothetical protein